MPEPAPWLVDGSWRARATEALTSISEAVYFLDSADRFTWLNAAAERLLERSSAELVGRELWTEFADLRGSRLAAAVEAARTTRQTQHLEFFYHPLDRWFEVRTHPVLTDLVVFFRDVHERRTLDDERAAESSLVRAVLNALPARTAILDGDGRVLTVNAAWAAGSPDDGALLSGRTGEDHLAACRAAAAAGDRDAARAAAGLAAVIAGHAPSFSMDHACVTAGGGSGRTWWHLQAFPVDGGPRVVVTHTDITDRVSAEHRAAWQARHDHLTALPNRAALHEAIATGLAEDGPGRVTVLYMDVDGFKHVNDSLGHSTGDLLLRELAARLSHRTRPSDVVGRLGGDEFVVLARDCDAANGETLAERFRRVFDEPFEVAGSRLPLTVSIGIATSGPSHTRPEDLLRDADAAMYAAKAAGPGRQLVFTPALRTALEDRWQLASGLRDAVALGQLVVHWQPVVALPGGEVTGCEALLRWEHPERGLVGPAEFVPIAEEDGLIVPITRWVLHEALTRSAAWCAAGFDLTIGVNVSAVHLTTDHLVDDVLQAVADTGADPCSLVVELTETSLVRNIEQAREQLAALRRHGVRVGIDDFGAGYSSLAAVATLPADLLKVDRSLVSGPMPPCPGAAQGVLGAVAALGAALGMAVLAEGIETAEQLAVARSVGCTFGQGHLLSRPLTADQLTTLLAGGGDGRPPLLLPD